MYKYDKNIIQINDNCYEFEYYIRKVESYKSKYYVLIEIPFDVQIVNNIYCLDEKANIVWQSEDLNKLYPKQRNLPFEQMGIKNNKIFASDFYGRNYKINIETGKIEDCIIVK